MSVIIDQLRISDDGQKMYIDAHVNEADYFENVYLKKITICTEDKILETAPEVPSSDYIYTKDFEGNQKSTHLVLDVKRAGELVNENYITTATIYINDGTDTFKVNDKGTASYDYDTQYIDAGMEGEVALHLSDSSYTFNEEGCSREDAIDVCAVSYIDSSPDSPFVPAVWEGYSAYKGDSYILNGVTYVLTKDGWVNIDDLPVQYTKTIEYSWKRIYGDTGEEVIRVSSLPTASADTLNKVYNLYYYPGFNDTFTASNLSSNMFFVYIECTGYPDPCPPCGLDGTTLGITFDYGVIYNQAMNFTKELADTCNIPLNFINYIMNYDALKLSIETDHYIPARNYWKNIVGEEGIFSNGSKNITSKPCGCHG